MDQRQQFAEQFRVEDGRLVFRHRGSGPAFPCTREEAALLQHNHDVRRDIGNRFIGIGAALSFAMIGWLVYGGGFYVLPDFVIRFAIWEPVLCLLGVGTMACVVEWWSFAVTLPLRQREPIPDTTSRYEALSRRVVEQPWSHLIQAWVGLAIIGPMLIVVASNQAPGGGIWLLAVVAPYGAALLWATTLKLRHERRQRRSAPTVRRRSFGVEPPQQKY